MFTLLMLTADRHPQVVACLTSLLFQLPERTTLLLYDNGEQPILECAMFRGLVELAARKVGLRLDYRTISHGPLAEMQCRVVEELPREGLLLWTDDDVVWEPLALKELISAMGKYRAVSPVVVDLLDRGFPDFTGLERLDAPCHPSPHAHLYSFSEPFEVESFGGTFLCYASDLTEWSDVPMVGDVIGTGNLPGPKAVVPTAVAHHLPHTRGESGWAGFGVPELYWKLRKERER